MKKEGLWTKLTYVRWTNTCVFPWYIVRSDDNDTRRRHASCKLHWKHV